MSLAHVERFEAQAKRAGPKPMKIVHVITRFIRGGADENTLLTCNGQAQLGHDVCLIYGAESHPEMVARLDPRVRGVELKSLQRELHPVHDLRCLFDLVALLRRERADLVHTHESKAGVLGRLAARLAGARVIVHGVHILAHLNSGHVKGTIYRLADWCAAQLTDLFIDVSDGMKQACLSAGLGRAEQHVVIESGMELDHFRNARARALRERGEFPNFSPPAPVIILIAGALEGRKRVLEFLDVFKAITQKSDEACLIIAGDGRLRGAVESRIVELGLEGRASCIGMRADFPDWIAVADICVHCAAREGLPRVVVQYVACAKPTVVTDLTGITQIVHHESNGFVTDLNKVEAMTGPLLRLVEDEDLRERMSAACQDVDLANWSAANMIGRVERAYELAIRRSGPLAGAGGVAYGNG